MTGDAGDISVVICTYTEARWNDLVAAVESVQHQTALPREILVVVDHNPGLLERVQAEIPGITSLENEEPRGLSGSRNSALKVARGAVIAFLDDDAVATPDWLAQLTAGYKNARVLGAGGSIEPWWISGRPTWFPEEFQWVVGCGYRGLPQTTAAVRNPIACNMSFRREVFEICGGFRTGIGRVGTRPVGCEETELCIRLKQHWPDGLILYEPRAKVVHRVPAQRTGWNYFYSRCYAEGLSKALVASLWGAPQALAAERTYTCHTLPRGILQGLRDAVLRGDVQGLARAGAIMAGLAFTTAGYMRGKLARQWTGQRTGQLPEQRAAGKQVSTWRSPVQGDFVQ